MKPLIVLISVFAIGHLLSLFLQNRKLDSRRLGRIAMSSMLVFTGIAHFVFTDGMVEMLPEELGCRHEIIYCAGIIEFLGAFGLLLERYYRITGTLVILFFVAIFPANVFAALNDIDPLTGDLGGPGLESLILRTPLQLLFVVWAFLSTRTQKERKKGLEQV